ncbi:beta-mannosidase [Rhipicephalus sanguineus]|uniref:beta-mannosidase n=1 Tax=Rhipicephalus sanguineus TaxID=34632 RepID=UPI0020C35C67|nr:beta-mannosidase [Rhipicephalus sanguineus]
MFVRYEVDVTTKIRSIEIERWWPSGYGSQKLYHLNVSMSVDDEKCVKAIRFGFRTVELVEDAISNDTQGAEFYFKINGVPIFAKGSNWIPADIFPERVTKAYIRDLLQSAKDANMNMIRVWGGGIYEKDYFYDLADELGILIWQDLMFSVSLYPADDDFLRSVATEVRQQVRRLQRHPCLIVWAGSNENEHDLYIGIWGSFSDYLDEYRRLYVYTIKRVIDREDKSRPFVSSSPSNGRDGSPVLLNTSLPVHLILNHSAIWKHGSPNSRERGDLHYYQSGGNTWYPGGYPIPRFVSEYGLLSHPSPETMRKIAPESTLVFPFSPFLDARQHHSGGKFELLESLRVHFGIAVPYPGANGTEEGYAMMSYLSQLYRDTIQDTQVVQAEGVRTGCESFRRWRSYLDDSGRGHTMGVLYWQLNDIWQAPSWSSIEYGGRWKMLHYFAKKFYSPVLVSPFLKGKDLIVFVLNDELSRLENVWLNIISQKWTSFVPAKSTAFKLNVPAASSFEAVTISLGSLWNSSSCSSTECFLWFTLEDALTGFSLAPEAYVLPAALADATLMQATIKVRSVTGPLFPDYEPYTYQVDLSTDNVAVFVWLDSQRLSGRFSDNGFLLREPAKEVLFHTSDNVTAEQLREAIAIYTVSDCTTKRGCPFVGVRLDTSSTHEVAEYGDFAPSETALYRVQLESGSSKNIQDGRQV